MLWPSGRGKDVISGILIGSVVTTAACSYLSSSRSKRRKKITRYQSSSTARALDLRADSSFFTDILEQMWTYIRIAGADTMRESVEPSFADLPSPMNTCRFTKIDLGEVPIRMDNIVVHPLKDGTVQFDLDFIWDGECDIQLKVDYIGSFGVRSLKLSGRMAIVLKPLTNQIPVVSGIQYCFINTPEVQLSFSGLASVADLSLLESSVKSAILSSMSSVVLPNRRLYKMMSSNNYLETYEPPIGVARITVQTGRGFVIEKRFLASDDIPDVYLILTLGGGEESWKTTTIEDNTTPTWNEKSDFCVFDLEQTLFVHAWDEDESPLDPDDDLGIARVSVGDLLLSSNGTMELPLFTVKDEEKTGAFITLSCEICEWVTDLKSLQDDSASMVSNAICGLLVVIINRAFGIPLQREKASTFVKMTYGSEEYDSKIIYNYPGWDALNPIYDSAFTIPITTDMPKEDDSEVKLELINIENKKTTILGTTSVSFDSLKAHPNNTIAERRMIGDDGASLEFRVSLSGVRSTKYPGHS